jgi:hypothetical protein
VDFMKWLNSLDELLYEVMSWLVFYPLTLWRTLLHPLDTMDFADRQLRLPEAEQYLDAVSPPLFLALTLALAHVGATAFGETDAIVASNHGLAKMINDDTSALVFRVLVFAIFPLMMSVRLVRLRGQPLNRQSLRLPFYAQSYPAAVFALGLSLGTTLAGLPGYSVRIAGLALILFAFVYYLAVETRWFSVNAGIGKLRAFGSSIRALIESFVLLVVTGLLFLR